MMSVYTNHSYKAQNLALTTRCANEIPVNHDPLYHNYQNTKPLCCNIKNCNTKDMVNQDDIHKSLSLYQNQCEENGKIRRKTNVMKDLSGCGQGC